MTAAGLTAEAVTMRFGGVLALRDVSIHARPGEILGLIGPNGAGKTTLFDILSGTTRPTNGRVLLDNTEITPRSSTWRARHGVRRTFQRQQVFGSLSVADNVLAATEWHGGGGGLVGDLVAWPGRRRRERQRRERVGEVLRRCGLAALADQPAGTQTIGVCRMIELARAIVDEPQVLLLDEPTSGLPEEDTDRLGEAFLDAAEHGAAVVLVEHDVPFVMRLCQRIAVLHLGEIIAEGTPEEIQANDLVGAAYLGGDTTRPGDGDQPKGNHQ